MVKKILAAVLVLIIGGGVVIFIVMVAATGRSGSTHATGESGSLLPASCSAPFTGAVAAPRAVSGKESWTAAQVSIARIVIETGKALHLDSWTITVGLATSMGESSLVNVDYGDGPGPDSRGIFQQRNNGAWGTYSDRMTPSIAATNYFKALMRVPNYHGMKPSHAAHAAQVNADPEHYVGKWDDARLIMQTLTGVNARSLGESNQSCLQTAQQMVPAAAVAASTSGWTYPVHAPITSSFDPYRMHPVLGYVRPHEGTDLGAPCLTEIHAAAAGVVVEASLQSGGGNVVGLDHGGGIKTRYLHQTRYLVAVGDQVRAGQVIGLVGNTGVGSGCHLHFETRINGKAENAVPFMALRGITLGQ